MSDLFNQNNMDISDLLGKYMGGAASSSDNTSPANTNENNQENTTQGVENNSENNSNNNDFEQTKQRQPSEADKGFSIFSNAMNQEQQKII